MNNDTQSRLWFVRKRYGWGWVPATWEGWLVVGAYVAVVVLFALTLDEDSPPREIAFTFILPVLLLTAALIRVGYAKGERPRWQWGKREEEERERPDMRA